MTDIPSTPFHSHDVLPLLLRVTRGFKHVFGHPEGGDTTMLQIQVLGLLKLKPHSSAKELSAALYLSSSATTQLLQRMVEADLLVRTPSKTDRRTVELSLSSEGLRTLKLYADARREKIKDAFSVLTEQELEAFTSILTKLHNNMQEKYHDK